MTRQEIRNGNELIADFLEWEVSLSIDDLCYHVPNNFNEDTGTYELSVEGFMFDSDWNWFMFAWGHLHRKVLIPIVKENPHLRREINEMISDMKSCLKWTHIEGAYKVLITMIKYYNNLFDKVC